MKGRTPLAAEQRWMDEVRELGCVVCRKYLKVYSPAEIHHVEGKTKPGSHYHVLPLCFMHHREGSANDLYISRHPYKSRFEEAYGNERDLLLEVSTLVQKARQVKL